MNSHVTVPADGAKISAVASRVSSPRLVGRARELAIATGALAEMGEGATSGLVIGGEAGVGKTRLLTELLDHARHRGALTLTGGCIDLGEATLPFGPIVEALRPLPDLLDPAVLDEVAGPAAASLGRFIPGPGTDHDDTNLTPLRLFELLFGVMQRLARRRPLVLAIEDLHWSDQSTRDLLAFLIRNLARERVLVAVTYRSDEMHRRHPLRPFLAELERGGHTARLDLAPLDRTELGELATDILGNRPSRALLDELLRRSSGNPFLAEELLAASDGSMMSLPPSLRDVLLARVQRLPDGVLAVLDAAAVVGQRVDEDMLVELTGASHDEVLDGLRILVSHHVLVPTDTGYRFRHALLQEAVYDELLPGERTRLHTTIAETLEVGAATDDDAALLAALTHHWSAAHRPERALEAAVRAGLAADELPAPAEAFVRYEQALELWRSVPDAETRSPVSHLDLLRLAAAAANLGDNSDRAIALAREALARVDADTDPTLAGELHERLGRYQWIRGDHEYLEAYEQAVRLVPAEPPSEARARVLAALGQGYMLAGRYAEGAEVCREAIVVARAAGARQPEGHARNTLGVCLATRGDVGAGEVELQESLRIAVEVRNFDDQLRSYNNLCDTLARLGRFDEATAVAAEGYALANSAGLRGACGLNVGLNLLDAFAESGRWDEMDRQYATLTEVAADSIAALNLAMVAIERGDLDAARPIIEQGRRLAASLANVQMATFVAAAEASLAAAEGRYDDGRAAIAEATRRTPPDMFRFNAGPMTWHGARAEADRAAAARARGDDDSARDAARHAAAVAATLRGLVTDGHPATAEGYVTMAEAEAVRARGGDATGDWEAAVAAVDQAGLGFARAYARYRLAESIVMSGLDRTAAEPALRDAVATFTALRADPLRLAAVRLAQRARLDVGVASGAGGTGALTPREHDVLTLVAAGCTNRQIADKLYISAKTASVHVSNILAKLQVRTRGEAAAVAHRDGLVGEPVPAR